jgi:hypothetical protein
MAGRSWLPLAGAVLVRCSGGPTTSIESANRKPVVDAVVPSGVPDRDHDPSVVAIDIDGHAIWNGVLIAPDIVLSAASGVMIAVPPNRCPAGSLSSVPLISSVRVLVSDEGAVVHQRASARELLVGPMDANCRPPLAFILLDAPIDEIAPQLVRTTGAARGDHLRTVAFAERSNGVAKLVRDHLTVLDATATQLLIGEPCASSEGGPAVDEATGDVVGIALGAVAGSCNGAPASDVYLRTDVLLASIAEARSKSNAVTGSPAGKRKTKKGAIDMGANCAHGGDCAAGVCVVETAREYCSRTCGPNDRCPTHFRCEKSAGDQPVCIEH